LYHTSVSPQNKIDCDLLDVIYKISVLELLLRMSIN